MVPVVRVSHLTEDKKTALRIADNQLTLLGEWDMPLLRLEVSNLKLAGFEMPLLGFQNIQITALAAGEGRDPNRAPAASQISFIAPGDVWLMGEHRLMCGDATDAGDVDRLLSGGKPHLMVTDAPYGVSYDPLWRERSKLNQWAQHRMTGEVRHDNRSDWTAAWNLFHGDVAYVWHASWFVGDTQSQLKATGLEPRALIIWCKHHFAISRGHYHWQHEPCWYAVRKGRTAHWCGGRKQTTVWDITGFEAAGAQREEGKTGHGTQKPIDCMERPMINNSVPGDGVYEPFVGSGTTIIACQINSRKCFAMEIDPVYVDQSIRRWQDFAGGVATLEGDGRTYDQVCDEREATFATAPKGNGATVGAVAGLAGAAAG